MQDFRMQDFSPIHKLFFDIGNETVSIKDINPTMKISDLKKRLIEEHKLPAEKLIFSIPAKQPENDFLFPGNKIFYSMADHDNVGEAFRKLNINPSTPIHVFLIGSSLKNQVKHTLNNAQEKNDAKSISDILLPELSKIFDFFKM